MRGSEQNEAGTLGTEQHVFVLQHQHRLASGEESVLLIGVYQSRNSAEAAVKRLAIQPGFCEHPNVVDSTNANENQSFHIDAYVLDKDHWTSSYVSIANSAKHSDERA